MVVGEVPLDVQDVAERPAGDHPLELAHGGEGAACCCRAAEHHAAALRQGRDRALGLGARERERFFAPDVLAGGGRSDHLVDVQRMRGGEEHRLHLRVGDRVGELGATAGRRAGARRIRAT